MSKTRDTGYLANVIQVHDTGVRIMSGSTMLMAVSSSGAVTITGEMSGSDAANALLLDGTGSLAFTTTASYNAFSASYAIASGSLSSRTTQVEQTYASTGSNTFTGAQYVSDTSNGIGFTSTASFYTDGGLRVGKNAYVSGTAYFNNIVVFGTSSIQYITSSQVNIGANIITVNTDTPAVRFGGLSVFDSGSTQLTGSILWDSEKNHWVYSNPSGSTYSGGMFISGPRSSALGSEQGTTACMLLVGQGSDHLTSSLIYHSSTVTCIPGIITGGSDILLIGTNGNVYGGTTAGSGTISNSNGSSYARFFGACHATTPNVTSFVNGNSTTLTLNANNTATFTNSVGINCATPGYTIDVAGTAHFRADGGTMLIESTQPTNSSTLRIIQCSTGGNGNTDQGLVVQINAGDGTSNIAHFYDYNNGSALSRFVVRRNGNVGIGCSTPINKLTVNGNIGMPNSYNWGVVNDNDANWGFKVCSSANNYSTFISYAGDQGSDRRGGIYNQNGHWVAYGNCVGNFIVTCNLSVGVNITAGNTITAGGKITASSAQINGSSLTQTQQLINSTGNFANMVHKVFGAAGGFSTSVICVNLNGAGGYGYIINSGGTGGGVFQSGGGYINGPGNFSHNAAVGTGFTVSCHTCAGTDNIVRFVGAGGTHPFVSIQMFGSLNQAIDDNSIYIAYS